MTDLSLFDEHVRYWAFAACTDWACPPPDEQWFEVLHARLPVGLRTEVGRGIRAELIRTVDDHWFTVPGSAHGPFSWFRHEVDEQLIVPNWDAFVRAAEYTRVALLVDDTDLRVGFDEEGLDIAVHADADDLRWYIEVEERFDQAYEMSRHLDRLGAAGISATRHGDGAVNIANRIVERRPDYFSLVGIGGRLDFSVAVHDAHHFDLIPDFVPVGSRP